MMVEGEKQIVDGLCMVKVFEKVGEVFGWGKDLFKGIGMGMVFYFSYCGYFVEVIQVMVMQSGSLMVDKIWVVGDVGCQIINLLNVENQMQGVVFDGLVQVFDQEIIYEGGCMKQSNFYNFKLLCMDQVFEVEVYFILSDNVLIGFGELVLLLVLLVFINVIFVVIGQCVCLLLLLNYDFSWS